MSSRNPKEPAAYPVTKQGTFDRQYRAHRAYRDSGGSVGKSLTIKDRDLTQVNLRGYNLHGADFYRCKFSHLHLISTNLENCIFTNCELDGTIFLECNLRNAGFIDCLLERAVFDRTDLSFVDFYSSDLTLARFKADCRFLGTYFQRANLRNIVTLESNLVYLGCDPRGYNVWAYGDDNNVVNIAAGCRHFVGIDRARAHWQHAHGDRPFISDYFLGILDALETIAPAKGLSINPVPESSQLPLSL